MAYKLVSIDLDGTLLTSTGEVTPRTRAALQAVRARGITLVVCTGRPLPGIEWVTEYFGAESPMVLFNGALVLSRLGGETVFEQDLAELDSREIWALNSRYDLTVVFWCENKLFTNRVDRYSLKYGRISGETPREVRDIEDYARRGIVKFVWLGDPDRVIEVRGEMDGQLPQSTVCHTSSPGFLEFVDRNVSKGLALATLCKHLGVEPAETIAIGDGENDLPMIQFAGCGVAVANAREHVRASADVVVPSNDEEGVVHALEQLVPGG